MVVWFGEMVTYYLRNKSIVIGVMGSLEIKMWNLNRITGMSLKSLLDT